MNALRANTLAVDRIPVRWWEQGAGTPLILLYGEHFARDLGAPLRRIPHGRHFTPEDHPEVIAEEIERLLAEVGPLQ